MFYVSIVVQTHQLEIKLIFIQWMLIYNTKKNILKTLIS